MACDAVTATDPLGHPPKHVLSGLTIQTNTTSPSPQSPLGSVASPGMLPLKSPVTEEKLSAKQLDILNQFSFEELQHLHQIGARLREAGLVVKLNMEVLAEIQGHYEGLRQSANLPDEIGLGCAEEISDFFRRANSAARDLEMEHDRLETLMLLLSDGKALVCARPAAARGAVSC